MIKLFHLFFSIRINDVELKKKEERKEISHRTINREKKCKRKLLEYYNKTNDSYLVSVILDPRLKLTYFQDNNWEDELVNKTQKMLVYYYFKFYYYL